MNLQAAFDAFIKQENLPMHGSRLLLAVSGGLDSVVLCHLCKAAGFNFSIAHCNFRLRGEESNADEVFAAELAAGYGVPFYSRSFECSEYASLNKMGIQEAARDLRYGWFNELLDDMANGLDYLVTAHHADDNIETLLMNFFKGTGIDGLTGMKVKKERLIRPLLFAFRDAVMRYANENSLCWREDSSNLSVKYTRNYFRHEVIPVIEKMLPQVRENLVGNIARFSDIRELYGFATEHLLTKLLIKKGEAFHVSVLKLSKSPAFSTLLFEISRSFGFSAAQVPEIIKLMGAATGSHIDSASHRIIKNRAWLIITPLRDSDSDIFVVEDNTEKLKFGGREMRFHFRDLPDVISKTKERVQLDASEINYPMLLRKWKTGDYFYPLGMKKKKKLSRFFIDLKLSMPEKESVYVLETGGRIAWVVGYRIDDRFKLKAHTQKVLELRLQ